MSVAPANPDTRVDRAGPLVGSEHRQVALSGDAGVATDGGCGEDGSIHEDAGAPRSLGHGGEDAVACLSSSARPACLSTSRLASGVAGSIEGGASGHQACLSSIGMDSSAITSAHSQDTGLGSWNWKSPQPLSIASGATSDVDVRDVDLGSSAMTGRPDAGEGPAAGAGMASTPRPDAAGPTLSKATVPSSHASPAIPPSQPSSPEDASSSRTRGPEDRADFPTRASTGPGRAARHSDLAIDHEIARLLGGGEFEGPSDTGVPVSAVAGRLAEVEGAITRESVRRGLAAVRVRADTTTSEPLLASAAPADAQSSSLQASEAAGMREGGAARRRGADRASGESALPALAGSARGNPLSDWSVVERVGPSGVAASGSVLLENSCSIAPGATGLSPGLPAGNLAGTESALLPDAVRLAAKGASVLASSRGGSIVMRLEPPALGMLRIELAFANGAVAVDLTAASAEARGIIDSHLGSLREKLESQGLAVERLSVHGGRTAETTPTATSGSPGGDARDARQDGGDRGDRRAGGDRARHDAAHGESRGRRDDGRDGSRGRGRDEQRGSSGRAGAPAEFRARGASRFAGDLAARRGAWSDAPGRTDSAEAVG